MAKFGSHRGDKGRFSQRGGIMGVNLRILCEAGQKEGMVTDWMGGWGKK